MTATRALARDDIMAMFLAAWNANTPAICTTVPPIIWQGFEPSAPLPASFYWVRIAINTMVENQTTLCSTVGTEGQNRYTASGIVVIQLFCPRSIAGSYQTGGLLAQVARNAFRGKESPNGVWFRNATVKDVSPEDAYWRFNMTCNFVYDDIG
jgi:hypothetical protein